MYSQSTTRDIKRSTDGPLKIIMADSDPDKVSTISSYIDRKTAAKIRVCKKYPELLPMLKEELPDFLLLGFFDALNSFSICRMCRKIHENLPIILLSRQTTIDDEMRRAALSQGATEIVSTDLAELGRILQLSVDNTEISVVGTGQNILTALKEINEVGNNFFGPLAQGNYWRKTHALLLAEHPVLQKWSADHFGAVSCEDAVLQSPLTEQNLRILRKWVQLYICECQRVIVDFGDILKNSDLSPLAIQLLP
jgi:hypothetical protein